MSLADPVPPIFHVTGVQATVGSAPPSIGGQEIRLNLTFHEGVRLTFAMTPAQALEASCALENAFLLMHDRKPLDEGGAA